VSQCGVEDGFVVLGLKLVPAAVDGDGKTHDNLLLEPQERAILLDFNHE
jgi:hypothetical protein